MLRALITTAILTSIACGTAPPVVAVVPPAPACVSCHPAEFAAWTASHHAAAERSTADVSNVLTSPPPLTDAHGTSQRQAVRVIGIAPLWQPMIALPDGRVQVSNMAYDPAQQAWFDVFADVRTPGDWGHWTGRGMTWNTQCAHCHNTGVTRGWNAATDTYTTRTAEVGVTCAACHSDADAHARDPKQPTSGPHDREAVAANCERCHTRGVPLVDNPAPGAPLLDVLLPALPGAEPTWWPDGQLREESFEGGVFRTSKMHAAGVRCTDCHDAHSAATVRVGDTLCQTCHAATPAHSHHDGAAPTCVDCHMPTTVYMQRDPRHDHGFRIPDPALSRELGSPSACAACHTDSDAMVAAATKWWQPREHERARARAVAAAQAGEPDAPAKLQAVLADETHPFWQVVLIAAGAQAPDRALDAWEKLGRAAAPSGLLRWPDDVASADPLAVRLATERAAMSDLVAHPDRDQELGSWLIAHADYGGGQLALAHWYMVHDRTADASRALTRATEVDPRSVEAWQGRAVLLASTGRAQEAVTTLDQAVAAVPESVELHLARGMALAGVGRVPDALTAFERVLVLDPQHPRAAYNAGLALHQLRRDDEAIVMLRRAGASAPQDASAPYALATILLAQGDKRGATTAAREALGRQPDHAGAKEVLALMGR